MHGDKTTAPTIPGVTERQNEIVFVTGKKGGGKSTALWRYFARFCDRLLTFDATGEIRERSPNAYEANGFEQTREALREISKRQPRWHIIATNFSRADYVKLFSLLCPIYQPGRLGFSQVVGGMAVETGEVHELAPNGSTEPEIKNAWRAGRHQGLSILAGTQRPAAADRLCSSMADWLIAFRSHEPLDLQFWERTASKEFAAGVGQLPEFHSLWLHTASGTIAHYDATGELQSERSATGAGGDGFSLDGLFDRDG